MGSGAGTLGIIGLGLMGGSAALKLKEAGLTSHIIGYDISESNAQEAKSLGIIDEAVGLKELQEQADTILLAIPVDKAVPMLTDLLEGLKPDQLVIDMGSTKERICKSVAQHGNRSNYVACHPIAGTEHSGPAAAHTSLFEDKVNIICDQELSSSEALENAQLLIQGLGMRNKYMNSADHDRHIAYVSHLSHISSFMLGKTVLEVEPDENNIFDMAGSGFASTVRLAKSSPAMWAPIFAENSENIVDVLTAYIGNLEAMKQQIIDKNKEALQTTMHEVNKIKPVLDGETIKIEK
jgi:prephenate dehydrogenase